MHLKRLALIGTGIALAVGGTLTATTVANAAPADADCRFSLSAPAGSTDLTSTVLNFRCSAVVDIDATVSVQVGGTTYPLGSIVASGSSAGTQQVFGAVPVDGPVQARAVATGTAGGEEFTATSPVGTLR